MGQQVARIERSGAPRRRRTASTEPLQKMSFQLHSSVAEAIRAVVNAGEAPSANVFVEEAVKLALRERRRERVYAAYAEAAQDEAFMSEMVETEHAFRSTHLDGER
jgi:Arc/MetJ-type ribon-helix-helix transcriptional regulator